MANLTSGILIRAEGKLPDAITDAILSPFIDNAARDIKRIIEDLYSFGGIKMSIYEFSYADVITIASGSWDTLKTAINTALTAAGEDELDADGEAALETAADDFKKGETLLALADSIVPLGTRPTEKGGFITTINAQSGESEMLSLEQLKKLEQKYYAKARRVLHPHLQDLNTSSDDYPEWFEHPDFALSIIKGMEGDNSSSPRSADRS